MSSVGSVGSNSVSRPATTLGVVLYNGIRGTSSTRVPDTAACTAASVGALQNRAAHNIAKRIVRIPALHFKIIENSFLTSRTAEDAGRRPAHRVRIRVREAENSALCG